MGFISGLKGVFKKRIYIFIIFSFILIWVLILTNSYLKNELLQTVIIIFGGGFLFFCVILFCVSFFKKLDDLNKWFFLISFIIAIVLNVFLSNTIFNPTSTFYILILLNANLFFTSFFAFKLCMDSATKVDDYLYKNKRSRIVIRLVEFCVFGFLVLWFFRITITFFSLIPSSELLTYVIRMLQIMFWVNVVLMVVVLFRLIITKKLSAFITLFFLLTFFYTLYILFDLLFGIFFSAESGNPIYVVTSFIIDISLFLYILGVVYDRVDYIQAKLKIFKVDTIALFLIIMKSYAQVSKTFAIAIDQDVQIFQATWLFIIFMFFNLIFGIHSIFAHKYGKGK
jgi:hypothetical protein